MTTRGQILRSSTTGNVPAAGTRKPGEVWTNFPDLQLGVIDVSGNAQRLVAVRYFSTTAAYATGDFVVQGGALYAAKAAITAGAFNASQWARLGAATDAGGPYLALTGGTLTGALILNAIPTTALGAATKSYVDSAPYLPLVGGTLTGPLLLAADPTLALGAATKNYADTKLPLAGGTLTGPLTLSGPPTQPLQAATKAYVDSGAFVPLAGGTMTGDLILNRDAQVPLGAATLEQVSARGAGDNRIINGNFAINQRGYVSGTALAAAAYGIDRWKAGTGGCTYTFTAALPDTTITITAGTLTQIIEAGMIEGGVYTLAWAGTAQARVYQGTPTGAYAASPIVTASLTAGTNTIVEFNAGTLTRVKLEIGSVATPFNRQSLAKSMADCQRYFQSLPSVQVSNSYSLAGNAANQSFTFQTMRATPTCTVTGATSIVNCSGQVINPWSPNIFVLSHTATAAGPSSWNTNVTLAAEL